MSHLLTRQPILQVAQQTVHKSDIGEHENYI